MPRAAMQRHDERIVFRRVVVLGHIHGKAATLATLVAGLDDAGVFLVRPCGKGIDPCSVLACGCLEEVAADGRQNG